MSRLYDRLMCEGKYEEYLNGMVVVAADDVVKYYHELSRPDFKQNLEKRNIFQRKSGIRYWDGIGLLSERTESDSRNFDNSTGKEDNSPY